MSSLERREYSLEELIPFGGGRATQEANRAELARLRAIEVAAREVADIAGQIPVVCDSPELAALDAALATDGPRAALAPAGETGR